MRRKPVTKGTGRQPILNLLASGRKKGTKQTGKSDRRDAAVMTIVWCIFGEVYLRLRTRKRLGITKEALMCYLPFRRIHPQFHHCWFVSSGFVYSDFNVSVIFRGLLRFVLCIQQQQWKKEINYREKYIIQPHCRGKKKLFSGLFQSGNVLCWCLGMS